MTSQVQNPTPQSADRLNPLQHLVTDDVASMSPVQHTTQDATELLSPLLYLNADDVQFLGPVLHSTPDTREHSITTSLHERQ